MSDIIPFDQSTAIAPLANAKDIIGEGNIKSAGESLPTLSIAGKTFALKKGGNEQKIMLDTPEGKIAAPSMKLVILNTTPGRTRTYFGGAFVKEQAKAPDCYSYDGEYPATDVENPISATCAGCPYSVKGSEYTTDGKATSKCKQGKFLAVVPSQQLDHEVYRLKLPITSVYSPEHPEEPQGWFAWDQYYKFLQARGISSTYEVETTVKFDQMANYPKLLFKATGRLGEQSLRLAHEAAQKPNVNHILGLDKSRNAPAEPVNAEALAAPAPVQAAPQPVAQQTPQQAHETAHVEAIKVDPAPQPVVQEAAPQPVVAPTPAAPQVAETDDDLSEMLNNWT